MVTKTSKTLKTGSGFKQTTGRSLKSRTSALQASDTLLFLKNLRSIASYLRDEGAAPPKLLYRMRLSVLEVRACATLLSAYSFSCL